MSTADILRAAGVTREQLGRAVTARQPGRMCEGCGHGFHRDTCPRKGPSKCMPRLDEAGRQTGFACSRSSRWPCPCPFGECHECGAPIVGACPLPLGRGSAEVDIDRGSAGDPDGTWIVWQLPDGRLACRPRLFSSDDIEVTGEQPGLREWIGRAHACQAEAAVS